MDNPTCIFHGHALDRLEKTLGIIDTKLSDIRVEVAGTTAQLKQMNGSVTRVTKQVDDHEDWLRKLQSTADTAKGMGTGAVKWIAAIVVLSNALAAAATFIAVRFLNA